MATNDVNQGILKPKSDWPTMTKKEKQTPAIDILSPGSDAHARVLEYLLARFNFSRRKMSEFYDRWKVAERKVQAYIKHSDYEKILKDLNKSGWSPQATDIVVPYSYSIAQTRSTYLLQTFAGRKPVFQVTANRADAVDPARAMETKLQYDCDHNKIVAKLWQFFLDNNIYGLGIMRCNWTKNGGMRTKFILDPMSQQKVRQRTFVTTYEGNDVANVDPFMFFPDPRVPMHQVADRGEFVFCKTYEGRHTLKAMEADKKVKYVDASKRGKCKSVNSYGDDGEDDASDRSLVTGGDAHPGSRGDDTYKGNADYYEVIHGTCIIVPAELGIGESEKPEKWLFAIAGRNQIIMAQPFEADHDKHPFVVSEPNGLGYGFGSISQLDMLSPLQDNLSWYLNSHVQNVRAALNNMVVVDPSRFEIQDIKNPGPGKIIRAKQSAYGVDLTKSLYQLPIADVTGGHVRDFQMLKTLADSISAVTDNLRGIQDAGGRKTATEVRTAMDAGTSRLGADARVISAQALVGLAEMMSLNNQQYLSDEFAMEVLGTDGTTLMLSPQHIVGDYVYPVADGTMPMDRLAMIDVWREIMMGISQNPVLGQQFNMVEMFRYIAELAGARNIDRFKIQAQPEAAIDQELQAGNIVPMQQLQRATQPAMGVEARPALRLEA